MNNPWITTITGKSFDLLEPTIDSIDLDDLCGALSHICRFGGHCLKFYSVAQHSYHVGMLVPGHLKLPALLHDAHEAFWGFGDILTPAKKINPELERILKEHERKFDKVIAERFGFDPILFDAPEIKKADLTMFITEYRDLMHQDSETPRIGLPEPLPNEIKPWDCRYSEMMLRREIQVYA